MILNYFCLLLLGTCCCLAKADITTTDENDEDEKNEIQEAMDFLKSGDNVIKIDDNYRDLVMMLGNTGTGKSAVTRFVAGDLADLESVDDGGFIIKYRKPNVIGEDTTVSQTIYPELVVDDVNVAYYDCPGYDDTRNTSIEIAETYFVKRVVDHAASLKLILVANYDSVRVGGHRTDFPNLVEHIHQFVKNVSLYKDSIALIATKVDNLHDPDKGGGAIKSDEDMIKNIVRFLTQYRGNLQKGKVTPLSTNALALVNILLTTGEDETTYTKIGLFRKPTKAGFFNDDEAMVEGRRKLRAMIANRVVYTSKQDESFGYTLSQATKLKITDLVREINNGITQSMKSIGQDILEALVNSTDQPYNLVTLTNYIRKGQTLLTAIINETTDLTAKLLVDRLVQATKELEIPISHENITAISNEGMYIDFLRNFTDGKLPVNPNDWVTGLKDCIVYLEDNENWYTFLSEIYDEYSKYEFRKELTKYNVKDVNDWGQEGKPQGISINSDNFWTFVQKQKNAAMIKNQKPDKFKMQTLNELLDITLKQSPSATCVEGNTKLLVKGDYVRLNDVNMTQCGSDTQNITIMALHTVFIDSDINGLGKRLDVAIVAPKWYIYGDRTFELSGSAGIVREAVEASKKPNVTADSGLPGLPGVNAGNLIGLALDIVNGEKLHVIAVGGIGGRGQDGGHGFSAAEPDLSSLTDLGKGTNSGIRELEKIGTFRYMNASKFVRSYDSSTAINTLDTDLVFHGICDASAAGNGGIGGKGGRAGLIKTIQLGGANSSIVETVADGGDGEPGIGGSKGQQPSAVNLHHKRTDLRSMGIDVNTWTEKSRNLDPTCPELRESSIGTNSKDFQEPAPLSNFQPAFPINEFMAYTRERQADRFRRADVDSLVREIQNNNAIMNSFNTFGFIYELQSLDSQSMGSFQPAVHINNFITHTNEKQVDRFRRAVNDNLPLEPQTLDSQFFRLKNAIDFAPYYQSLCDRIERYVSSATAPADKKVLTYLYAAAWSKYLTFDSIDHTKPYSVIDVENYLSAAITNIQKAMYEEKRARNEIITETAMAFYADTEQKIVESSALIQTDILPAIANRLNSIDDKLQGLVTETIESKKTGASEDRRKYAQQLEKLINIRGVVHFLRVAGIHANCLSSYGQAAGAIARTVSQVGDGFTDTGSNMGVQKVFNFPTGLKQALNEYASEMRASREEHIRGFEDELKLIANNMGKYPEALGDTSERMKSLQNTLEQIKANASSEYKAIDDIQNDVSDLLKTKEHSLEVKKWELSEDEKKALEAVKKSNKRFQMFANSVEIFKRFKDDEEKLEEVSAAMVAVSKKLTDLKAFESKISDVMRPMVDAMLQTIHNAEQGLPVKSAAVVDLKKWQIRAVIGDTKLTLRNYMNDFTEQPDDLRNQIQILGEVFAILVNIYDRIESYNKQQKLCDFVADISSADREAIQVNDPELRAALVNLDSTINKNILLGQYKLAIDGFQQSVFPFAGRFIDNYQLPPSLKVPEDFRELVGMAVEQLGGLLDKIRNFDVSILSIDENVYHSQFDVRYVNTKPFYAWSSNNYSYSIQRLMSGEKVSFLADINSGVPFNAVKFTVAELYIQTENAERQAVLENILRNYDVRMTHMGNSYYRCDNSSYIINSRAAEIIYSFERHDDVPLRTNAVYAKIKNGHSVLSPYAMWSIQLENMNKFNDNSFERLAPFADRVDLFLVGRGQYIKKGYSDCGNSLDQYYRSDTTM